MDALGPGVDARCFHSRPFGSSSFVPRGLFFVCVHAFVVPCLVCGVRVALPFVFLCSWRSCRSGYHRRQVQCAHMFQNKAQLHPFSLPYVSKQFSTANQITSLRSSSSLHTSRLILDFTCFGWISSHHHLCRLLFTLSSCPSWELRVALVHATAPPVQMTRQSRLGVPRYSYSQIEAIENFGHEELPS